MLAPFPRVRDWVLYAPRSGETGGGGWLAGVSADEGPLRSQPGAGTQRRRRMVLQRSPGGGGQVRGTPLPTLGGAGDRPELTRLERGARARAGPETAAHGGWSRTPDARPPAGGRHASVRAADQRVGGDGPEVRTGVRRSLGPWLSRALFPGKPPEGRGTRHARPERAKTWPSW